MSVNPVRTQQLPLTKMPKQEPPLIKARDIKAILYLGIRGEITLPIEKHEVDILA